MRHRLTQKFRAAKEGPQILRKCEAGIPEARQKPAKGQYSNVPIANIWVFTAYQEIEFEVPSEMSPAMKARYDQAADTLADPKVELKVRLAFLDEIAAEQHLFAARFVAKTWKDNTDPAIKAAALNKLLDLLQFGTAYESLPDMVKLLKDEDTPAEIRKRIFDIIGKMWLAGGLPGFRIGGLAGYRLPEDILKEIVALVKSLSTGKDPYLAAKAREILKTIEAKEKEAKEAKAKQAAQPAPPVAPKATPPK